MGRREEGRKKEGDDDCEGEGGGGIVQPHFEMIVRARSWGGKGARVIVCL